MKIMEKDLLGCVGNTPLIYIDGIFVKLEYLNPSGSTKDRIAKHIILEAEKAGKLKPGMEVAEATSGNSGIAFSMVCAIKGYKMNVLMPQGLSNERIEHLKAYGANIILTPKEENVFGAVKREIEMSKDSRYFAVMQFDSESNINAYEATLGKEILEEVDMPIGAFVAGVGTGGTLIGVGRAIRKKYPSAKLFAVEPKESAVLNGRVHNEHKIEGIGDGFVPDIYRRNRHMIGGVIEISSEDAIKETRMLARRGILAGISSGANMIAAREAAEKYKNVVTVFPDRGDRYFSTHIYDGN